MTLFVIPSLYYELMVEKKTTRVKILFWTIIFFPIGIGLLGKSIVTRVKRARIATT